MPLPILAREALFEKLATGHAAKLTVLTPNRRLALELAREFDARQLDKGLASWEAPDILPLGAFLQRVWDDALHADAGDALPRLLTPAEEQHLWEAVIDESGRGDGLIAKSSAAAQCADAWRLLHAWRLGAVGGNEDAQAFAEWSAAYQRKAGQDMDSARLPDLAATLVDPAKLKTLVAYAFDIVPPQVGELLVACAQKGIEVLACEPPRRESTALRAPFPSAREELEAAASWARARLESPFPLAGGRAGDGGRMPRIGIVIPDLQQRRKAVLRVFSRVMDPAGTATALPFNVSIGAPLSDYPLVAAALGILELAQGEVEFTLASRLIRSPFIGGAESERAQRARLDAWVRKRLPAQVTLAGLIAAMGDRCPSLRKRLEAVLTLVREHRGQGGPHEAARHFSEVLSAIGFPGERTLDSEEFQVRERWNETLAALSQLSRVSPRMGEGPALAKLRRACHEELFQPESADAPVQVLGILESAGLVFDHLWVTGLSDEAWPLPVRPNPFIPIGVQKQAGVPQASAEGALDVDRRLTEGWLRAAPEVVLSHPLRADDRELAVSPLVAEIAEGKPAVPALPRWHELQFAARRLESVADGKAPSVAQQKVGGGTRVLVDQSACPFRAFARHRLGARTLEAPVPGMDAADRGQLLHALMAALWRELKDSNALAGDVTPAINRAAAAAVHELKLEGRFAVLERERLARLAQDWLDIERRRKPFQVRALEEKRPLAAGPLLLEGRIDRMDRLEDGTHALIDYKSGEVTRSDWLGERPGDPQLPLYAVAAGEDISAVAFAQLKPGKRRYTGYGRDKAFVDQYKDWPGLLEGWRTEVTKLGTGFAAGDAAVDPKKLAQTCRNCDLQPLCRVHEKLALLEGEEEGE
jgi:ATP-dependent helicase/nuclease subunit B